MRLYLTWYNHNCKGQDFMISALILLWGQSFLQHLWDHFLPKGLFMGFWFESRKIGMGDGREKHGLKGAVLLWVKVFLRLGQCKSIMGREEVRGSQENRWCDKCLWYSLLLSFSFPHPGFQLYLGGISLACWEVSCPWCVPQFQPRPSPDSVTYHPWEFTLALTSGMEPRNI